MSAVESYRISNFRQDSQTQSGPLAPSVLTSGIPTRHKVAGRKSRLRRRADRRHRQPNYRPCLRAASGQVLRTVSWQAGELRTSTYAHKKRERSNRGAREGKCLSPDKEQQPRIAAGMGCLFPGSIPAPSLVRVSEPLAHGLTEKRGGEKKVLMDDGGADVSAGRTRRGMSAS